MCVILLSINPEHVKNIFCGKKLYEFRKIECKKKVEKIIIYSTSPIMKVVGEAHVEEILKATPEEVWKETRNKAGIDKKFFDKYYKNREYAIAYKLSRIKEYKVPKTLNEFGIKKAPQSFVYINKYEQLSFV